MRALLIGDVHLADNPPSSRIEGYADQVLNKLAGAVALAASCQAEVIVQAGDMFHVKAPSKTSHRLVQQAADVLTAPGIPVRIVPGNHDVQHDRMETLPKQPLGTLAKVKGIELLMGVDPAFPWLFGIPYQWNWAMSLPNRMREWHEAGEPKLIVTHAPIVKPGVTAPYEVIDAADWERQMVGMGILDKYVYYGHHHWCDGSYKALGAVTFCNQGSLSRGSLHEDSLTREPAVTWWEGESFTRLPIPHLPASQVFKLAEREQVEDRKVRLDEFLGSVQATELTGLSVEEVLDRCRRGDVNPLTLKVVEECIEAVR